MTPFFNGFAKEQNVINAKNKIDGCFRTFFVHGKLKTVNFPWCMAKWHQTTLGGQACKCHMGWKLESIILLQQFNQDVIC